MYERLKLEEIADGKRPFPTSEEEFAAMLEAVDDDELYQKVLVAALVQSNQMALDTLKEGGIVPTPMVIARAKIVREERKRQSEANQRKTMEANRRPAEETPPPRPNTTDETPPTRPATMVDRTLNKKTWFIIFFTAIAFIIIATVLVFSIKTARQEQAKKENLDALKNEYISNLTEITEQLDVAEDAIRDLKIGYTDSNFLSATENHERSLDFIKNNVERGRKAQTRIKELVGRNKEILREIESKEGIKYDEVLDKQLEEKEKKERSENASKLRKNLGI